MPITPNESAQKRHDSLVTKLCDLIDKSLTCPTTTLPFEFTFKQFTPQEVIFEIKDLYSQYGWNVNINQNTDGIILQIFETPQHIQFLNTESDANLTSDGVKAKQLREQKELMAKYCLENPDGMKNLLIVMCEPIHMYLKNTSILYSTLVNYDGNHINVGDLFTHITHNGKNTLRDNIPHISTFRKNIVIESHPDSDFLTIDRLQSAIAEDIQSWQHQILYDIIENIASLPYQNTFYTYPLTLHSAMADAFTELSKANKNPSKILISSKIFHNIFEMDKDNVNIATNKDKLIHNLFGNYRNADLHLFSSPSENNIIILSESDSVGAFSVLSLNISNLNISKISKNISADVVMDMEIFIREDFIKKVVVKM